MSLAIQDRVRVERIVLGQAGVKGNRSRLQSFGSIELLSELFVAIDQRELPCVSLLFVC